MMSGLMVNDAPTSARVRGKLVPRSFYARDALAVAPALLGLHLVRNDGGVLRIGRIVETEAYRGPEDLAAHSAGGRRTARTEIMYGPAGHAYVYLIYGFWNCMNVVVSRPGRPHAVLLRALEPLHNLEAPTWGPGLLCKAMNIDRTLTGMDLLGKTLWIERPTRRAHLETVSTTRIGVAYAREWARRPWRFYDRHSPYVSTLSAAARRRALALRAAGRPASHGG
jgi:DNA-3-methyladenine glycosylase